MIGLARWAETWPQWNADDIRRFAVAVVARIQVHAEFINIMLKPGRLMQMLVQIEAQAEPHVDTEIEADGPIVTLTISARLRRTGKEMKIVVKDGLDSVTPDPSLVRVLVRAHGIRTRLFADKTLTLEEIAKAEGMVPSYATRLFRLTLLAPDIVSAILSGKQPPELTARKLMDDTRLPLDWSEQRRSLGFA
jgi:hypothetical protein